jgi:hypothetical protein
MQISRISKYSVTLPLLLAGVSIAAAQSPAGATLNLDHPAVGSWFGKAVQLCADPNNCPQAVLWMTPTMTADGTFLGNDSLALAGPPFGPHTTAHGKWSPTSDTEIIADYVFMLPGDPSSPSVSALRFRWSAQAVDPNTMVGYVNIFLFLPIPATWENVAPDKFPAWPSEADGLVTPPVGFLKDPAQCTGQACPLVFKFVIHRVSTP